MGGLLSAWTTEEMLAAYEPLVILPLLDRRPASDTIEFKTMPRATEQRKTTMDVQDVNRKISQLVADFISLQRSGKKNDREYRANLHRGRGSSLKKLNRMLRTRAGLRPEKFFTAAETAQAERIWARIADLRSGLVV